MSAPRVCTFVIVTPLEVLLIIAWSFSPDNLQNTHTFPPFVLFIVKYYWLHVDSFMIFYHFKVINMVYYTREAVNVGNARSFGRPFWEYYAPISLNALNARNPDRLFCEYYAPISINALKARNPDRLFREYYAPISINVLSARSPA